MDPSTPPLDPALRLDDLLTRWEEAREAGQAIALEELCADSPDLLPELRRRVQALSRMNALLGEYDSSDSRAMGSDQTHSRTSAHASSTFDQLSLHAQGGLGEVYQARAGDLDRADARPGVSARSGPALESRARAK